MGQDLQVVEVGGADLEAPGGDVVVALQVNPDFALAGFQAGVELTLGNLEGGGHFLGHVLIIKAGIFAALALRHFAGFQVFGGSTWNHGAGLAQDFQGFAHFLDAHPVAGVAVALLFADHVPVEVVVALVVVDLAQVPGHPRGAQHRPRQAPVDRHLAADHPQPFDAAAENRVVGNQLFVFIDLGTKPVAKVEALFKPAVGKIGSHPANAEIVVVDQPLAGSRFP